MKRTLHAAGRLTGLLLAVFLIVGLLPAAAFAAPETVVVPPGQVTFVNPFYARGKGSVSVGETAGRDRSGTSASLRSTTPVTSEKAAGEAIRDQMIARETELAVTLRLSSYDGEDVLTRVMGYAFAHDPDRPQAGDYLYWTQGGWTGGMSGTMSGGVYTLDLVYHPEYYTTAAQESYVNSEVAKLVSSLGLSDPAKSDYRKVQKIYEWMTDNIEYDYDHVNDDSYKLKNTAYAALKNKTAVCQGYSVLFYRLAMEAGIDARIISGVGYTDAGSEAHGWNIVKIGDKYYPLDSTWDASRKQSDLPYKYFLIGLPAFSKDHVVVTSEDYTPFWSDYVNKVSDTAYVLTPGPIANVAAAANGDVISVSWSSADDADSYYLQKQVDGGNWTLVSSSLTSRTYSDSDVAAGHTYRYRVRGRKGTSSYGPYTMSQQVTLADATPGEIGSVAAAYSTTSTAPTVVVSWSAAENAAGYVIQKQENGGSWTTLQSSWTGTSYEDQQVVPGSSYRYRVKGRNGAKSGPYTTSAAVSVPLPAPGPIGTVTAAAEPGQNTVTWTASEYAAGYDVERQEGNSGEWVMLGSGLTGLTYTDSEVVAGTAYRYRVCAYNDTAVSGFAFSAEVTALGPAPGPIGSVQANVQLGTITVSWDVSENAGSYFLQRKEDSGTWKTLATSFTGTVYTDTGFTPGSTVQYQVRGRRGSAFGAYTVSNVVAAPVPPPGPIGTVTATAEPGKNVVTWTASEYAETYCVERQASYGWVIQGTSLTGLTFTDLQVEEGQQYTYRVYAVNQSGQGTAAQSNTVTALGAAPGEIAALTTTAEAGQNVLAWTASENAAYYMIQRSENGGGWTSVTASHEGLTYVDTAVTPGNTYRYQVCGCINTRQGAYKVGTTVTALAPAPGPISSVTATPVAGAIEVTWTASEYADTYLLQRRAQTGGTWSSWTTLKGAVTGTAYTDSAVTAGTLYQYRVRGRSGSGQGALKTSSSVKALAVLPGPISSIKATASPGAITVTWTAAENAVTYLIQRREQTDGVWGSWVTLKANISGTSYTDSTVTPKVLYQYRARGRNSNGNGPIKSASSVRAAAMAKPGAISSVSLQAASGGITVSWSAAAYAESYMLQRQTYGESAWTTVKSVIAGRTYTDAAVKAGTKYRYRVRAKNVSGYGAFKVSAYAVAASSTVPGSISSVTASATSGKITVKWSAASNATMYMIQRRAYAGGAWGSWTTMKSNQTGTSYTDGTAAKGTKYQYRVRGRNSARYGSYKCCSTVTAK